MTAANPDRITPEQISELLRLEAVRAFVERSALVFDPKEAQQQNQRSKFEQG